MLKRKFDGEVELEDFVLKKRRPTFNAFITQHLKDSSKWSTNLIHLQAQDLFSEWKGRFIKVLAKCEKRDLVLSASDCKFNKDRWMTILATANELADVELEYTLIGTKLIRKTSSRVYDDASAVIGDNNSVVDRLIDSRDPHVSPGDSQTTPSDSPASQVKEHLSPNNASAKEISLPFDIADLEQKVHKIVYDYFSGNVITKAVQKELQAIMNMKCSNSDCSLALIKLGAKHMLKQEKTPINRAIIKLSISRIYNLIDTRFETIYKCNVSPAVWQIIESEAAKLCVGKENYLSCGAIKMFGQIVEQQSSKAMLKFIDKEKYLLSSCDKEDTEEYTVLLLVEQVVRNLNRHRESDSEATCYRRFASLLEILLDGTDITMIDGEKASKATKVNNAINNAYFGIELSQYGRKIDLILSTIETIEICASEFKKESTDDCVIIQQQSKNLRTNASVLRHVLYPLDRDLDTTMAIDFIGTNGYLYALRLVDDDFFIAKPISQLIYPKEHESLDLFLETIKSLFFLKHFLRTTAKSAKKSLYQRKANNALPMLNTSAPSTATYASTPPPTSFSSPFVFTSPPHC